MLKEERLQEEEKRIKLIVDLTAAILMREQISREEALDLVRATKKKILQLFPDKEAIYDLIYKPRLERLLRAFVRREFLSVSKN